MSTVTHAREAVYSTDDVERYASRAGSHFFDRDAMRFFRSRVHPNVYALRSDWSQVLFVTSERYESYFPTYHSEPRLYTIRVYRGGVEIGSLGEFQRFTSSRAAHKHAERVANRYRAIFGV